MKQTADSLQVDRTAFRVTTHAEAEREDREYWFSRTPVERLQHVEILRELNYALASAFSLTNKFRSRNGAGLSSNNIARMARPGLANQGLASLRLCAHAHSGGRARISLASATATAARYASHTSP